MMVLGSLKGGVTSGRSLGCRLVAHATRVSRSTNKTAYLISRIHCLIRSVGLLRLDRIDAQVEGCYLFGDPFPSPPQGEDHVHIESSLPEVCEDKFVQAVLGDTIKV